MPLLLPADICHLSARKESPVTVHFLLPVKPYTSSRDHYLEVGLSLALSLTRSTLGKPLSNETSSKKKMNLIHLFVPLKEISSGSYTPLHVSLPFLESTPEAIF